MTLWGLKVNRENLKATLDALYANRSQQHLANDPLSFCHRFVTPEDREIAGLIASSFAYGNVKIILRNLETIFSSHRPVPAALCRDSSSRQQGLQLFAGFKHRFNDSRDLCALLYAMRLMLDDSGSIEAFFWQRV